MSNLWYEPDNWKQLADYIHHDSGQLVEVIETKKLSGGAIQENVFFLIKNKQTQANEQWVIRADSESVLDISLTRENEFALLQGVYKKDICIAEPLFLLAMPKWGKQGFVMRYVAGETRGHMLVDNNKFVVDRHQLVVELAKQLARLHQITPEDKYFSDYVPSQPQPINDRLNILYQRLNKHDYTLPVLDLAYQFLIDKQVVIDDFVLTHGDYRVGNFIVQNDGLAAILDWEFCHWSSVYEDIAWFCAACWRFKNYDLGAGGLAKEQFFVDAYEMASGQQIDRNLLRYWKIFALFRWAVIAIEQGQRHYSGEQVSLELLLTPSIVYELNKFLLAEIKVYAA